MQLDQIGCDLLEQAIQIYLKLAYPETPIPESVLALCDWGKSTNNQSPSCWEDDRFEIESGAQTKHYFLRLGNYQYPHMKLGVVACSGIANEYVFVADTHDRHFELDKNAPDYDQFQAVQRKNEALKAAIEKEWMQNGIPTPHSLPSLIPASLQMNPIRSGKTILVVDDTPATLELLRTILERREFNVIEAANGHAALAAVDTHPIDACILDIMMPDMSGYEVIKMLELSGKRTFPIMFASAMLANKVQSGIADDLISKPFTPKLLIEKLDQLLTSV